jgi:hypothetical protein
VSGQFGGWLNLREGRAYPRVKLKASGRKHDPTPFLLDEVGSNMLFEMPYMSRDDGMNDAQLISSCAYAISAPDHLECTKSC